LVCGQLHDGVLGLFVQHQTRRVSLGVAADDHHFLFGLGQRRDEVLCRRRFADAALAVNRTLAQRHDRNLLL
jgi:hypothetical protein